MSRVEKKAWPELFREVLNVKKTFDLRLNDFEVKEGDTLLLREWDPTIKEYTGRELERRVGYVGKWKMDELTKFWPKEDINTHGIQVISLKE